jgi:hypothetical protein
VRSPSFSRLPFFVFHLLFVPVYCGFLGGMRVWNCLQLQFLQLIRWTPLIELKRIASKDGVDARIVGKMEAYQPLCSVKDRSALRYFDVSLDPTQFFHSTGQRVISVTLFVLIQTGRLYWASSACILLWKDSVGIVLMEHLLCSFFIEHGRWNSPPTIRSASEHVSKVQMTVACPVALQF